MKKKCKGCSKIFESKGNHHEYCAKDCSYQKRYVKSIKEARLRAQEISRQATMMVHIKDRNKRPCLKCGKTFLSEGKHNRVCHTCKGANENAGPQIENYSFGPYRR